MKKLIVGVVMTLFLGGVVLGRTGLWSHTVTLLASAREAVQGLGSDEHETARARLLLDRFNERTMEFQHRLRVLADNARNVEGRIASLEKTITSERGLLERAQALLNDEGKEHHTILTRCYGRAEIAADSRARLSRLKESERQLAHERKLLADLKEAEAEGRKSLTDAVCRRQELIGKLDVLGARLQNARLRREVLDGVRELGQPPITPEGEIGRIMAGLDRRAAVLESVVGRESEQAVVQWEPKANAPDVHEEIRTYLSGQQTSEVSQQQDPTARAW